MIEAFHYFCNEGIIYVYVHSEEFDIFALLFLTSGLFFTCCITVWSKHDFHYKCLGIWRKETQDETRIS